METGLTVLLQPKGMLHRFIRHKDASTIVERPERLRAVSVGVAAATARLEEEDYPRNSALKPSTGEVADDLAEAMDRLALSTSPKSTRCRIAPTTVSIDFMSNNAVRFIHGEPQEYVSKLASWASSSEDKIRAGESEIPSVYSQGDLYLCPQSLDAIVGGIATVIQSVDISVQGGTRTPSASTDIASSFLQSEIQPSAKEIVKLPSTNSPDPANVPLPKSPPPEAVTSFSKTFAAIRPPGHHCSDDLPSGFCFVNNVAIAAAHAHLHHKVNRIVILDIDLHHGNGTQAIAWSINAETRRKQEESAARVQAGHEPFNVGPLIYYASLHDILSFPCENGDPAPTQAASVSLMGPHGQYIENVHLEPYSSEEDFFERLYPRYMQRLIGGASQFLESTSTHLSSPDDNMVFISAGFDASPHEHSYMSRHNRNVPTSFYTRFAADVCDFAETHARGRVVSVLEGGYSDWALMSGSAALITGLAAPKRAEELIKKRWWEPDSLALLEPLTVPASKVTKPRKSKTSAAIPSLLEESEPLWLTRTKSIIETMDPTIFAPLPPLPNLRVVRAPISRTQSAAPPPSTRTLRDRSRGASVAPSSSSTATSTSTPAPVATAPKSTFAKNASGSRTPQPRTPASSPPKPKAVSTSKKGRTSGGGAATQNQNTPPPPLPKFPSSSSAALLSTPLLPAQDPVSPGPGVSDLPTAGLPPLAIPASSSLSSSPRRSPGARIPTSPESALQQPVMIRIKLPARTKPATSPSDATLEAQVKAESPDES